MEKVPITRQGYERLYWQLRYLCRFVRREMIEDLAEARSHGITSRNLEWRTAREKQHLVESRIKELKSKLTRCEIRLSPATDGERVDFGLFVEILSEHDGRAAIYQMVGPFESDVSAGRLSVDSPVGQVLMGCRKGDRVTVLAPGGIRTYLILDVFGLPESFYGGEELTFLTAGG